MALTSQGHKALCETDFLLLSARMYLGGDGEGNARNEAKQATFILAVAGTAS